MIHLGTKELETARLILRPFKRGDAGAMFRNWAADPAVTRFLRWQPHADLAVSEEVLAGWIAQYDALDYYQWAIVPRAVGEPIGSIGAVDWREDLALAHIGYCIGQKWWRQGYTAEALAALIRFFFEGVGLNRVESMHDPRNPASGAVMRKAGMTYEGTLRQADINNLGVCDCAYYAILREGYHGQADHQSGADGRGAGAV